MGSSKEYNKEYNSRLEVKERVGQWRIKNKDTQNIKKKARRDSNLEHYRVVEKERYYKNKEHLDRKSREWMLKKRKLWYLWFKDNKLDKCSICGYDKCFAAIDFHHIGNKSFGIASFVTNNKFSDSNVVKLKEELGKCTVVCCRCHRELHYAEIE